jgi:hypothetical protein
MALDAGSLLNLNPNYKSSNPLSNSDFCLTTSSCGAPVFSKNGSKRTGDGQTMKNDKVDFTAAALAGLLEEMRDLDEATKRVGAMVKGLAEDHGICQLSSQSHRGWPTTKPN